VQTRQRRHPEPRFRLQTAAGSAARRPGSPV